MENKEVLEKENCQHALRTGGERKDFSWLSMRRKRIGVHWSLGGFGEREPISLEAEQYFSKAGSSSDRVALDLPKPIEGLKRSVKLDSVVLYIIEESGENITARFWKKTGQQFVGRKRTLRVTLIVSVVNDLWCSNDGNDGIPRVYSLLAGYGKLMGHLDVGIFEEALQSLVLNAVFAGANKIASYMGPILITHFVNFLSGKGDDSSYYYGLVLALILFMVKTMESLLQRQWYLGRQQEPIESEIPTSHLNASLLSEEINKLSDGNCDRSGSHHEGDISSKLGVSSSAELHGESHTTENIKCAIGVHGKDINAGVPVPISTPSKSTQIRIRNAVSKQSDIHNFDSDVLVVEVRNVKLSTDLNNMEHEIDGSLPIGE
ncbi:hypothetical protein VitviT2T_016920 [Vitis vinifera]|uniref:Uncharacterized protein n=1 Tax=Vitis vinifera TaxID=29760 RepID=A0ABY9CUL2_VITVI|nr:hypothetical protein VitviT2T_016920 [Vitis vinifera]